MSISSEMKQYITWIGIGLLIAGLLVCLSTMIPGCGFGQRISAASKAFSASNPTAAQIPVDEEGDGIVDFLGVDADGDHKVDTDPAGELIEVPGSRREYADAGATGGAIAESITLVGTILGLPIMGLVGKWWGKRKPLKQFTDLVRKFEEARVEGGPEDAVTFSRDVLKTFAREQPGAYLIAKAAREAFKAEKSQ